MKDFRIMHKVSSCLQDGSSAMADS